MKIFSYAPLDLERSAFRLLQLLRGEGPVIECLLHQVYLDGADTVPYNALSYTWGGTEKTSTVIVDGKTLVVTENLYMALQHLRLKDEDQVLWVDAICIDQENLRERGQQVRHMCKIYSQAEEVIVWLGGATDETNILMDSLDRLEEYSSMYPHRNWDLARWTQFWLSVPQSENSNPRKGLELLLQRPWFRRVWILQEIANAKRARVRCGIKFIKAHIFALAPKLMRVKPERHCQAVLDIMPGSLREESWWSESRDLYNLLLKFKESEATDSRDKVYALLGISSDTQGTDILHPDYTKSLQEVVRDTSSFLFGPSDVSYKTMSELVEKVVSLNASSFCQLIKASDASEVGNFLMQRGLEVPLSEDMITAAAGNQAFGKDVMTLLLQQRGSEVKVTEEVIKAAAGNEAIGRDIMAFLLQQRGSEVKVTEEVIKAAAGNEASGRDVITLLFQQRRSEVEMTAVIEAVAGNGKSGKWVTEHIKALQEAFVEGHWTAVNMLLDKRADIDTFRGHSSSVLYTASEAGHKATVKLLLDKGADPNVKGGDYSEDNALQTASYRGHEAVVKLLLDAGADPNAKGRYNGNALQTASYRGHKAVVKLLLNAGAEVNAQGGSYSNALQAASEGGHEAVVELLLDAGADPNAKGRYDGNALQTASEGGHKAVVKLLLNAGAEVNAQGGSYSNALQAASEGGHEAVLKILVARVAKSK
jgi:ankyrin repeat protein